MHLYPLLSAQTRALLPAQLDSIVIAMAATVALQATESETAFEALVAHHKLKHLWPVFQSLDWTTASVFAFVLGVNYSTVVEEEFITKVVCPLLKQERHEYDAAREAAKKDCIELIRLRLLFTKCTRMLHISLKSLETTDAPLQNISQADRRARRKNYAAQLDGAGLYFEDDTCHAHCIEDDAFLMLQKGYLTYLHPRHCPTRGQETAQEHLTNKGYRPEAYGFKVTDERTSKTARASFNGGRAHSSLLHADRSK